MLTAFLNLNKLILLFHEKKQRLILTTVFHIVLSGTHTVSINLLLCVK